MKKLILFLAVAATVALITGCDPSYSHYFNIKNDTQSEVIVKIGNHESVSIPSGDRKIVYSDSSLGATDPFEYIMLYKLTIMINEQLMSQDFWQRGYWTETENDKYRFTYTLTLTDELIESILSEQHIN